MSALGRKRTFGRAKIFLSYSPSPVLASSLIQTEDAFAPVRSKSPPAPRR